MVDLLFKASFEVGLFLLVEPPSLIPSSHSKASAIPSPDDLLTPPHRMANFSDCTQCLSALNTMRHIHTRIIATDLGTVCDYLCS